jgi:import receptor subunit TOM22
MHAILSVLQRRGRVMHFVDERWERHAGSVRLLATHGAALEIADAARATPDLAPEPLKMATTSEVVTYSAKRLATSFGKALWLATTTMLVLVLPLVIEMDREQQLVDMEKEQMGVLTGAKA